MGSMLFKDVDSAFRPLDSYFPGRIDYSCPVSEAIPKQIRFIEVGGPPTCTFYGQPNYQMVLAPDWGWAINMMNFIKKECVLRLGVLW